MRPDAFESGRRRDGRDRSSTAARRKQAEAYSLWLMPGAEAHDRLAALIASLAQHYGTPGFEPHLTLLGRIARPVETVLENTKELSRRLAPVEIRLTEPGTSREYFRCLFMKAERTDALLEAHALAKNVFRLRPRRLFMPHLSLLYGHLDDREKRKALAELRRHLPIAFQSVRLRVLQTQGPPPGWRAAASFHLSHPPMRPTPL